MKVVDASVAAKWFLPEQGTPAALELLTGRERLIAPALIRIEVSAALVRAFRESRITEDAAREACQAWDQLLAEQIVQLIADDDLYELALKIAFEIRHSVQDCLYLAAGKVMKAQVVTADDGLAKRGLRNARNVRLIGIDDGD